MKIKLFINIFTAFFLWLPSHCFAADSSLYSESNPLRVVATVGMIGDIAQIIGGNVVIVKTIMGAGIDPHLYKASPADVRLLIGADLILYNGLFLEGKMADILKKYSKKKKAIALGEHLDKNLLISSEAFQGHPDPHIWMDVSLWQQVAKVISTTLSHTIPEHSSIFEENFKTLNQKLSKLHVYAKKTLHTIPKQQRVMITAHDAFSYFGRAYDISVRGIQGISTESEAGLKDINEIIDFIVERKIKAVFVESSVSQKNIEALIEGAQSRGHEVKIGGELFSDAMGKSGTEEGTYLGMIKHNVITVAKGLGGEI